VEDGRGEDLVEAPDVANLARRAVGVSDSFKLRIDEDVPRPAAIDNVLGRGAVL
jgi:hypothetical protein